MNITNESRIDGVETQLFAQVHSGDPEMKIDSESRLRHSNFPGADGSLFLGDVGDALLRCFGAHEPPRVTQEPGFDQQRWSVLVTDTELSITTVSYTHLTLPTKA